MRVMRRIAPGLVIAALLLALILGPARRVRASNWGQVACGNVYDEIGAFEYGKLRYVETPWRPTARQFWGLRVAGLVFAWKLK